MTRSRYSLLPGRLALALAARGPARWRGGGRRRSRRWREHAMMAGIMTGDAPTAATFQAAFGGGRGCDGERGRM